MKEVINLLSNVSDSDRAVFITALKEFPKEARYYTKDPATISFNKKVAKSAKNKLEVKASYFSADEIRVLYTALFLLNENLTAAQAEGFVDEMSAQFESTLDKSLPILGDFVNSLLEQLNP